MNSRLRTSSLARSVQVGLLSFLLLLSSLSAQAQTTNTWTGGTDTDWNTTGNWSLTLVPTATHNVVIPSGSTNQPILSTTAVAKSMIVSNGASLTITGVGSLTINGSFETNGFKNAIYTEGPIRNDGKLYIGTTATDANYGIWNLSLFTNNGELSINNTSGIGLYLYGGTFANTGRLDIGNVALTAQDGIQNNGGTLINNTTGEITINRPWANGIWNLAGSIQNAGQVIVGTIAGPGNGVYSTAPFTNTGEIRVDRCNNGVFSTSSFANTGQITIGASASLSNQGVVSTGASATFVNSGAGNISINRTGTNGLSNASGSTFTNSATITLGPTVSGTAVENLSGATFDNQGCPALLQSLGNAVITNAGSFSNTGTVIENASGNSNISFNGGLIVNNNGGSFTVASGNAAVSAGAGLVWQGCVSSDWNTAGNWYPATVPTATDNAIIQLSAVNQPIISTTAVAKSVNVQTGASLSISNVGSLSIDGSTSHALSNSGIVTNAGRLLIGSLTTVAGVGISMAASGSITNSGTIQIDRTGSHAIQTAGLLNNASIMRMGSLTTLGGAGISNTGMVNNNSGAQITINRSSTGTGSNGLFNGATGTFVNSATLTVGDIACDSQDAVFNAGSFTNTATGEMQLDRAFGNGIWHTGTFAFQNDGKIRIGSLANTGGSGILNAGLSFSNTVGAVIDLDRVGRGITNTKPFVNAGRIRLGSNASIPGGGILNGNGSNSTSATITNLPGGLIQIDAANHEGGITNEGSTTFTNSGTVTIGVSGSIVGHAINNTGTVLNQPCAVITAFAPVYNENGTFTNNGFLTVNTLRKPTKTVVRVNSPSGIARTYVFGPAGYGPNVGTVNLTADAVLVNDGTANPTQGCFSLASGSLTGKIALVDRGTCASNEKVYYAQQAGAIAVIMLSDVAGGPPGMFGGIYASLITIPAMSMTQADGDAIKAALTPGPVNISITQEEVISTTLVTNNGVIDYPQGNPIPNVTNNDLIVNSFSLCGTSSTTALQIGGSNSFSVGTTWYTDAALTTAGGTYNAGTNTFTPTSLSVGTNTLYFTATDNVNNCAQTVSTNVTVLALPTINITANSSLTIASGQSATFTASGGSSYSWSSGESTTAISVNVGGTYSVTGTTNGCSGTASVVLSVTSAAPIITTQPATASSVCEGASVMTSAIVSNSVTGYQWLKNGSPVAGQTGPTLSLGNVQVGDAGVYSLSVTGPGGSTTSNGFTLTVNPLPTATITFPNSVTVAGSPVPVVRVPSLSPPVVFQASGGSSYERLIIVDRINGYEVRQNDSNNTGIFPITRLGLFTLTVTGAGGCQRTVQWLVQ